MHAVHDPVHAVHSPIHNVHSPVHAVHGPETAVHVHESHHIDLTHPSLYPPSGMNPYHIIYISIN